MNTGEVTQNIFKHKKNNIQLIDTNNTYNRHVILPKSLIYKVENRGLLSENEWRALGIQQGRGWMHYEIHEPEPWILLFRRPVGTDPHTGI